MAKRFIRERLQVVGQWCPNCGQWRVKWYLEIGGSQALCMGCLRPLELRTLAVTATSSEGPRGPASFDKLRMSGESRDPQARSA